MRESGRRAVLSVFIFLWISSQILIPLAGKFDWPGLHYKSSPFGWAMFSRLPVVYEVSLSRRRAPQGEGVPIPDLHRVTAGLGRGESVRKREFLLSVEQVRDHYSRLIRHIARERADGWIYEARIRWLEVPGADPPPPWRFTWGSEEAGP